MHITCGSTTVQVINDNQWAAYKEETGFDLNSPEPADPLFVDAPTDMGLTSESPAIKRGNAVEWNYSDYRGVSMNLPPDLGAIQYGVVLSAKYPDKTVSNSRYEVKSNIVGNACRVSIKTSESECYTFLITDMKRKVVLKGPLFRGNTVFTLPLSRFSSGVYFVGILKNFSKAERLMILR